MTATIQIELPDDLKALIDRQIAEGRATSQTDYLQEAARRYAEDLDAQDDDLAAIAKEGIADAEAGNYTQIETDADSEALHQRIMAKVRATLSSDHD